MSKVMDQTDIQITELHKGNARMSCQELGDKIGLSRVAAGYRFEFLLVKERVFLYNNKE